MVSIEAMSVFLDHFAAGLASDEHAVMVLDYAGWHGARALRIPDNVSLVPLPPYALELNPVERVWLFLRERFLSHRLLGNYDAIVNACCQARIRINPERRRSLLQLPIHSTGQSLSSTVSERRNAAVRLTRVIA